MVAMAAMACISLVAPVRPSRVRARAVERASILSASSASPSATLESGICGRRQALLLAAISSGICGSGAAFSRDPAAAEEGEAGSPSFETYYGTAASASSYGGYGGNASKKDAAEYIFEVPQGWKERLISKVEKGTNGTDSEFYNPRRKGEKTYLTFLAGFGKLAPRDNILNDLSLSDVNLQDDISQAESITSSDKQNESGQLYYEYEIEGPAAHSLIFVTCAKNKLYAHYVRAPTQDWTRDEPMLRHVHNSFTTVGTS